MTPAFVTDIVQAANVTGHPVVVVTTTVATACAVANMTSRGLNQSEALIVSAVLLAGAARQLRGVWPTFVSVFRAELINALGLHAAVLHIDDADFVSQQLTSTPEVVVPKIGFQIVTYQEHSEISNGTDSYAIVVSRLREETQAGEACSFALALQPLLNGSGLEDVRVLGFKEPVCPCPGAAGRREVCGQGLCEPCGDGEIGGQSGVCMFCTGWLRPDADNLSCEDGRHPAEVPGNGVSAAALGASGVVATVGVVVVVLIAAWYRRKKLIEEKNSQVDPNCTERFTVVDNSWGIDTKGTDIFDSTDKQRVHDAGNLYQEDYIGCPLDASACINAAKMALDDCSVVLKQATGSEDSPTALLLLMATDNVAPELVDARQAVSDVAVLHTLDQCGQRPSLPEDPHAPPRPPSLEDEATNLPQPPESETSLFVDEGDASALVPDEPIRVEPRTANRPGGGPCSRQRVLPGLDAEGGLCFSPRPTALGEEDVCAVTPRGEPCLAGIAPCAGYMPGAQGRHATSKIALEEPAAEPQRAPLSKGQQPSAPPHIHSL